MSIAALSCSSQLGGFSYGAVGRAGTAAGSSLAALTLALEMDDHSHCLNRSSPSSSLFVSEITRYKLALIQQQQQQQQQQQLQQHNGSIEPRLADENNYMLRSVAGSGSSGIQCSVASASAATGTSVVVASSASSGQSVENNSQPPPSARPRSASLSLLSRLSSPCHHATHSHPPTPPPLDSAPILLARVKIPAPPTLLTAPAPYSRLLCACLPTCCCDCNLLSSIAECQAVYHQACARYIGSSSSNTNNEPAAGCCLSASSITTSTSTNEAAFNDVPSPTLPQTVPQDVVSLFFFFSLFISRHPFKNLFRSFMETKDA